MLRNNHVLLQNDSILQDDSIAQNKNLIAYCRKIEYTTERERMLENDSVYYKRIAYSPPTMQGSRHAGMPVIARHPLFIRLIQPDILLSIRFIPTDKYPRPATNIRTPQISESWLSPRVCSRYSRVWGELHR